MRRVAKRWQATSEEKRVGVAAAPALLTSLLLLLLLPLLPLLLLLLLLQESTPCVNQARACALCVPLTACSTHSSHSATAWLLVRDRELLLSR